MANSVSNPLPSEGPSRPFVTALCLTRNRREWLPKAINCFLSQTYEPKELLIIADGQPVHDLIPQDERIRLIYNMDSSSTIGRKRNLGCQLATGELIAHFDDDDWSAPNRLADQVSRLLESGKSVTGYHTMKFFDGATWCLFQGIGCVGLGTSLVFKKSWWEQNPFPERQVGEDNLFVSRAFSSGEFLSVPACGDPPIAGVDSSDLMYASIHPGNTCPRAQKVGRENYRVLPASSDIVPVS